MELSENNQEICFDSKELADTTGLHSPAPLTYETLEIVRQSIDETNDELQMVMYEEGNPMIKNNKRYSLYQSLVRQRKTAEGITFLIAAVPELEEIIDQEF